MALMNRPNHHVQFFEHRVGVVEGAVHQNVALDAFVNPYLGIELLDPVDFSQIYRQNLATLAAQPSQPKSPDGGTTVN